MDSFFELRSDLPRAVAQVAVRRRRMMANIIIYESGELYISDEQNRYTLRAGKLNAPPTREVREALLTALEVLLGREMKYAYVAGVLQSELPT